MVIALSSIPAIAHTATALHRHRPSPPPPFPPAPSAVPRCARGCTARSRAAWRRSTREEGGAPVRALTPPPQRTPRSASASPEPQPQPNPSPNPNLLPCVKTLVTLRCKLKRGPGLALGPLGAPEYESRLNSRSRVPLPTFSCIYYPFSDLGGGTHVVPQDTIGELGAAFGHLVPKMSGFVHVDSPRGQSNGHRLATTT